MKYNGEILGTCDSYNEDDDGSCSDVFEIFIEAPDRKTLEKLKNRTKVKIKIKKEE